MILLTPSRLTSYVALAFILASIPLWIALFITPSPSSSATTIQKGTRLLRNNNNELLASSDILLQHRDLLPVVIDKGRNPNQTLSLCEGDCDTDDQCDEGLICWRRQPGEPLPGCSFDDAMTNGIDVCILDPVVQQEEEYVIQEEIIITSDEQILPQLVIPIGNDGNDEPLKSLGICQGDCDFDEECEEGLLCFYRIMDEPVPGCSGSPQLSIDYCVKKEYLMVDSGGDTVEEVAIDNNDNNMLPEMEDSVIGTDIEEEEDLEELEEELEEEEDNMAIPTTVSPGTPTQAPTFEFLGPPQSLAPTTTSWSDFVNNYTEPQQLDFVGNDGDFDVPYPLGPCQGDCDDDNDCAENLVCYQRSGGEQVPGCYGDDESSNDYCTFPSDELKSWNNGFRIKLYWEEGYKWQNETFERRWCMTHDYEGSPYADGQCWYGDLSMPCDPDAIYVSECSPEDSPTANQLFDFIPVSSDEVLIQSYDEDRCLQRTKRNITMEACNSTIHHQRWFATRGGFNELRFELSQKRIPNYCANQDHHPKPGEVVRMMSCEKCRHRSHMTSWWDLY